ncbi:hypothetical protein C6A85_15770, partial [Mycobacterium sp. ITM-2017-0098]
LLHRRGADAVGLPGVRRHASLRGRHRRCRVPRHGPGIPRPPGCSPPWLAPRHGRRCTRASTKAPTHPLRAGSTRRERSRRDP